MSENGKTFALGLVLLFALAACGPQAAPTPTPTKAPAAAPTAAPAAAPTKAAEPTKPPAPTPTSPPAATPTPRPVTLKFGTSMTLSDIGKWMAMEKGYYKEQGITLELIPFQTIAQATAPLATGELDLITTPLTPAILAAADRGVDLKIVGGSGQTLPKWENSWILLRKDLADSGKVKTVADLKGMKVAYSSPGGVGHQSIERMLEQGGLKATDVETVIMPMAEQTAAFANKGIAAGFAPEPFIATGIQQGFSVKWIPVSQLFGGELQQGLMVYGASLLKDQDVGRRWMIAYVKGIRDYVNAFTTGAGKQEAINIMAKYSTIKDPKLYESMEMPYLDPNGGMNRKSLDIVYQWLVDKAFYQGKKTLDDVSDVSYLDYAVQRLGKR